MAAGRWVGRGDKNGGDGAAVDAMRAADRHRRHARRRRHRRGREGRSADALQRRGGRRRQRRRMRRRRRPDRRHHADGQGHAQRGRRHGGRRARHDVRPVGRLLHGEAGHRPGGRRRGRHHRAGRARTSRRVAKAKGMHVEDVTVCILDRPRHEELVQRGPRRRAPGSSSSPTATSPARSWRPARAPASTCCSASAARPEGIIAACALTVPRRRHCRAGSGRATTTSGQGLDAGHDLDQVLTTHDLVRSDNVFFVATGVTDGELLQRRALPRRRRTTTTRS